MLGAGHAQWQMPFMTTESLNRELAMQLPVNSVYSFADNSGMPTVRDVDERRRQSMPWAPMFSDVTITPSYLYSSSLPDYAVTLEASHDYPVESSSMTRNHDQPSVHDSLLGVMQMPY